MGKLCLDLSQVADPEVLSLPVTEPMFLSSFSFWGAGELCCFLGGLAGLEATYSSAKRQQVEPSPAKTFRMTSFNHIG